MKRVFAAILIAIVLCVMSSCAHRTANVAKFYVLSELGVWEKTGEVEIVGGIIAGGSSAPAVDDVKLLADADGTDFVAGDTISFVSWNSERDGVGGTFDEADPVAGDWYAKYKVTKCTVTFSSEFGAPTPSAEATEEGAFRVTKPADPVLSHFRFIKWCKDEALVEPFDFANDFIVHSTTLYASWETPLRFAALADACYSNMFNGCTSLTAVPALSATALVQSCYNNMFSGCLKIKLSETQSEDYPMSYRLPSSGSGTGNSLCVLNMFVDTGGTFSGTPSINTTYYLHKDNSVVPAN